jgi:hypothetical protein
MASAENTDQSANTNLPVTSSNEDLKNLRFSIMKELSAQNASSSEIKKNTAKLSAQNDLLIRAANDAYLSQSQIKKNTAKLSAQNDLLIRAANDAYLFQEVQATKNRDTLWMMAQFAAVLAFILLLVFWTLWSINNKLKKKFEIALNGETCDQLDGLPTSEEIGSEINPQDNEITVDQYYDPRIHQPSDNESHLHISDTPSQEAILPNEIDTLLQKRMEGFMRPIQDPKE